VQKLVPGMIERGHGTVVNISTVAATTPSTGAGIYGASKAALDLLTKIWADEFGEAGIRVNAIAPGPTETEGTAEIPEIVEALGRTRALGRVGEPDEIARAVAFIASPAASYINGVVLPVDGGAQALRPAA
jgi:NAD(P)-dependent dehydrogenase (short-subunit alcohol dehydrogenase family)